MSASSISFKSPRPQKEVARTAASSRPRRDPATQISSPAQPDGLGLQHHATNFRSASSSSSSPPTHQRKRGLAPSANTLNGSEESEVEGSAMKRPRRPESGLRPAFTPVQASNVPEEDEGEDGDDTATDRFQHDDSVVSAVAANASGVDDQLVAQSPFLQLPGEIRNLIYRYAIVENKSFHIIGAKPDQPGITKACRQTRAESLRIFYKDNSFACTILNYDPTDFKRYRAVADKHGLSTVLLTHRHDPHAPRSLLRANFLKWLEGTFRGETAPLGYSSGHSESTFVWDKLSHRIVKVFNQARILRANHVAWAIAKEILENAVDAAGVCGEKTK